MQRSPRHKTEILDCSHEVTPVLDIPADVAGMAWQKTSQAMTGFFKLDDQATDEIHTLATTIQNNGFSEHHPADVTLPLLKDYVAIPHCQALFQNIKNTIDNGVGFAVADRLPVDEYPADTMARVFWILGQIVGQPVAQKHNSQMIYDVKNTGVKFDYGVRGSVTNIELNFHTDNAFGRVTPEYVGLLCCHPAKEGGVSRFCSLYALHNQIVKSRPEVLERLYQPMYYDRQKEHAEGESPVTWAPYFSCKTTVDGKPRLRARANTSLVRKGYEVAGATMDTALVDALDAVDEISQSAQFWFEAALEKGQVQYLNNQETGHYRSEIYRFRRSTQKRHLYRLWHRNEGHWSYHGLHNNQHHD